MSIITTFPPELLHKVFAYLRPSDDNWSASWPKAQEVRQPLSACTLVSRSWHPIAHEHLFHDVVYSFQCAPLTDEDIAECLDESIRWSPYPEQPHCICCNRADHPRKTLQLLCEFLEHSSIIRSSIRRLRLAYYPSFPLGLFSESSSYALVQRNLDLLHPELFCRVLANVPLIRHLQLWNVNFQGPYSTPPSFCSVPDLKISYTPCRHSATTPSICQLLSCFAKVQNISFRGTFIFERPDVLVSSSTLPLEVHSLSLSGDRLVKPSLPVIFALLSRTPTSQNLRRLTLHNLSVHALPIPTTLSQVCGSHLEYLKLTLAAPAYLSSNPIANTLDLSPFANLRELFIGVSIPLYSDDPLIQGSHILIQYFVRYFRSTGLSRKLSPHLRRVTICLGHNDYPNLNRDFSWVDWSFMQDDITAFESHVSDIVRDFRLDGVHPEYFTNKPPEEATPFIQCLRQMTPELFPRLVQNNLIIYDEPWCSLVDSMF